MVFLSVLFGLFGLLGYKPNHIQIVRFLYNLINFVYIVYTKTKPYCLFRYGIIILNRFNGLSDITGIRTPIT